MKNKKSNYSLKSEKVDFNYYSERLNDKYLLPTSGNEGNNMADQAVAAISTLIYKWYGYGEAYDTRCLKKGLEDISTYANWLYLYIADEEIRSIMVEMIEQSDRLIYEYGLKILSDYVYYHLEALSHKPKSSSIYDESNYPFVSKTLYGLSEEEEEDY